MNVYTDLFKGLKISSLARRTFLALIGTKTLTGKLPKVEHFPMNIDKTEEAFAELFRLGLVLGTPTNYRLNTSKLDFVEAPAAAGTPEPAILTLLKEFNDQHSLLKRRKARSDQKSLLQLRRLVRKYSGRALQGLIEPFFSSKTAQGSEQLSCIDFCMWADKQLNQRTSKAA